MDGDGWRLGLGKIQHHDVVTEEGGHFLYLNSKAWGTIRRAYKLPIDLPIHYYCLCVVTVARI